MLNVHVELDWAPSRRYLYSGFSLLAEYFQQTREYEENDALTAAGEAQGLDTATDETTSGYYVLSEYRFTRNWAVSARYDSSPVLLAEIGEEGEEEEEGGEEAEPGAYTIYSDENLTAGSMMLSYYPSRFSAVRFQYSNKRFDDETWNEYWVQFLVLIGFERPDVF